MRLNDISDITRMMSVKYDPAHFFTCFQSFPDHAVMMKFVCYI